MNEFQITEWLKKHISGYARPNMETGEWVFYFDDLFEMFSKFEKEINK